MSRAWPILFTFTWAAMMGYVVTRMPKYETVTKHNVKVFSRVDENNWAMSSDEDGPFLYTGCKDFPNDRVIWAGYIADHAKWEEQGNCKSIRRGDLGFFWSRDDNYNVKEIR